MKTFDLYWSPEGRKIATVTARDASAAIRKAPKPYSKYRGEIYAEEIIDPIARTVAELGGELVTVHLKLPEGKNGGCGTKTHVHGTNRGQIPCGSLLKNLDGTVKPYFCGHCTPTEQKGAPAQ